MFTMLRQKMTQCWQSKTTRQKALFCATLFIFFVGVSLLGHAAPSLAQATPAPAPAPSDAHSPVSIPLTSDALLSLFSRMMLWVAGLFISITLFILTFVIEIAGYNGFLSSTAVSVGWVMVRDITNMGFVVILLIIAFGTILGLEQYEWKKLLVKFVLAAVLVNFSRLICGVIIDVGQVVMITFVNGIAATAGGNLINAFNLTDIRSLSQGADQINDSSVFIASVGAITFSAMVMVTMGVFLFMLLARMIVLWVLIVLSPLAFVLSVIPQTEKYASEWWSEFGANVVTGPVLLFFVWLSFVTVGSGNVHQEIADHTVKAMDTTEATSQNSGISKAMSWNSMANFAIAIGMLMVGARAASQLGGVGGAWAGQAVDFGKKVATIASGVAAARWVGEKASDLGRKARDGALYHAPLIGGKKWEQRGEIIGQAMVGWYKNKGMQTSDAGRKAGETIVDLEKQKELATDEGQAAATKEIEALKARKAQAEEDSKDATLTEDQKAAAAVSLTKMDEDIKKKEKERLDAQFLGEAGKKKIDNQIAEQEAIRQKEMGGGFFGYLARSGVDLEKQVDKTKKQAENRHAVLRKRMGTESGGIILGGLVQMGMNTKGLFGTGLFSDQYAGIEAQDRIEQGWYQAEEARSRAKDDDFNSKGRMEVLGQARLKYDTKTGKFGYEYGKGTMYKRIEEHKMRSETNENKMHHGQEHAREHIYDETEKALEEIKHSGEVSGKNQQLEKTNKSLQTITALMKSLNSLEKSEKRLKERELAAERIGKDSSLDPAQKTAALASLDREMGSEAVIKASLERNKKIAEEARAAVGADDAIKGSVNAGTANDLKQVVTDMQTKQKGQRKEVDDILKNILENGAIDPNKTDGSRIKISKTLPAWELARSQAEKENHDLFFGGKKEKINSEAAQMHIWNEQGVTIPNTAQLEIIEKLSQRFKDMNYEGLVAAVGKHDQALQAKRARGEEITFNDLAVGMALQQKMQENSWNDDGIIPMRHVARARASGQYSDVFNAWDERRERATSRSPARSAAGGGRNMDRDQVRGTTEVLKSVLGGEFNTLIKEMREATRSNSPTDALDKEFVRKIEDSLGGKLPDNNDSFRISGFSQPASAQAFAREALERVKNDIENVFKASGGGSTSHK